MNYSVFDIETDGLIENMTKIHCMAVKQYKDGVVNRMVFTDYADIKAYLLQEEVLVGHNICRFDIPVLEKHLGIKIQCRLVDTLALSWYLYPNRFEEGGRHGLESWGEDLGVPKPVILDWQNQSIEDYKHRCEVDVTINDKMFDQMLDYLFAIYGNPMAVRRVMGYLTFKMECAAEQESQRWRLDIPKCHKELEFLNGEMIRKTSVLSEVMPPDVKYKVVSRPKTLYKKDGEISVAGAKWLALLEEKGLPPHHLGALKVVDEVKKGNPGSHAQLKSWLFSLGWVPATFKYPKDKKTGVMKKIPQINTEDGDLCDSIKALFDLEPNLEHVDSYFKVRHRIGLINGFLEDVDSEGYLKANINGLANTLRFMHKTIVNLPTIYKAYGENVRGCLIANEGHILCGSDVSGLEDSTKQHYIYKYDPKYVEEMQQPGFDAHIDIGVLANMITRDDQQFFKNFDKATASDADKARYSKIRGIRLKSKKVNFMGIYGAGPDKISLFTLLTLDQSKALHTTYWKRNHAVKKIAKNAKIKTVNGQMWLYNPVSEFWYSLRFEKDKFSTLNQSTGVYVFDSWVRHVRKRGIKLCGQFHDEIIFNLLESEKEQREQDLRDAIAETNAEIRLNVQIKISVDFGNNYAEIH